MLKFRDHLVHYDLADAALSKKLLLFTLQFHHSQKPLEKTEMGLRPKFSYEQSARIIGSYLLLALV